MLLFIALWQLRTFVAFCLLGMAALVTLCGVLTHLLECLNEQELRRVRVRYREELPLDEYGYPLYLPGEMRQARYYQSRQQPTQGEGYYYERATSHASPVRSVGNDYPAIRP